MRKALLFCIFLRTQNKTIKDLNKIKRGDIYLNCLSITYSVRIKKYSKTTKAYLKKNNYCKSHNSNKGKKQKKIKKKKSYFVLLIKNKKKKEIEIKSLTNNNCNNVRNRRYKKF